MGSVAAVALVGSVGSAYAFPDRYEQGYACTGLTGMQCVQQQSKLEDGNRAFERSGVDTGPSAGRDHSLAARGNFGNNVDSSDNEVGDEISHTANEAGDAISHTADEAGDAISHAAGEAGDAISDAFN
jgi:hypothetical protein